MRVAIVITMLVLPACTFVVTIVGYIKGTLILPHKMNENEDVFTPYLAFVAANNFAIVIYYIIFLR